MFHEIVCYVLLFLSCCLDFILVFAISVCSSAYFLNREKDRGGEKEVKREKIERGRNRTRADTREKISLRAYVVLLDIPV